MSYLTRPDKGTSDRGPSPNLWNKSKWLEAINDPSLGFGFHEEFLGAGLAATGKYVGNAGMWTLKSAGSTATVKAAVVDGGVLELDSVGSTASQGGQIWLGDASTGGYFTPEANTQIYFETKVGLCDAGGAIQFFAGLAGWDDSIIASAADGCDNSIGFLSLLADALGVKFFTEKATVRSNLTGSLTNCHTLVDGTDLATGLTTSGWWVKLGFRVNGISSVDIFVNGTEKTALKMGANNSTPAACIPIIALQPAIVCQTANATDPILYIDWVRCFKQYCVT